MWLAAVEFIWVISPFHWILFVSSCFFSSGYFHDFQRLVTVQVFRMRCLSNNFPIRLSITTWTFISKMVKITWKAVIHSFVPPLSSEPSWLSSDSVSSHVVIWSKYSTSVCLYFLSDMRMAYFASYRSQLYQINTDHHREWVNQSNVASFFNMFVTRLWWWWWIHCTLGVVFVEHSLVVVMVYNPWLSVYISAERVSAWLLQHRRSQNHWKNCICLSCKLYGTAIITKEDYLKLW